MAQMIRFETVPARLRVEPWPDPVLDREGHDPRSRYVEQFWLPVLGPSAVLLLRRLAGELEERPAGTVLEVPHVARSLGLGLREGRNAPVVRTIGRLCQFRMAHVDAGHPEEWALFTRRRIARLNRLQVDRLPPILREAHRRFEDEEHELASATGAERMRRRARHLALSLLEIGESAEETERQLHRWRFHPAVAREAAGWAWARHAAARQATGS